MNLKEMMSTCEGLKGGQGRVKLFNSITISKAQSSNKNILKGKYVGLFNQESNSLGWITGVFLI